MRGKKMTKTKKRKMSKSTFAIIIMAVVMVAMLAFGGTYAYFTATASEKEATFTTGLVRLQGNDATFVSSVNDIVPGDALTSAAITLQTTSEGTNSYVAIRFTLTAGDADLTGTSIENVSEDMLSGTPYTDSTWEPAGEGYPNVYILAATTTPTSVPSGATINITDEVLRFEADDDWDQDSTDSTHKLMDATITITIEARSVQVDNFASPSLTTIAEELFSTPLGG